MVSYSELCIQGKCVASVCLTASMESMCLTMSTMLMGQPGIFSANHLGSHLTVRAVDLFSWSMVCQTQDTSRIFLAIKLVQYKLTCHLVLPDSRPPLQHSCDAAASRNLCIRLLQLAATPAPYLPLICVPCCLLLLSQAGHFLRSVRCSAAYY